MLDRTFADLGACSLAEAERALELIEEHWYAVIDLPFGGRRNPSSALSRTPSAWWRCSSGGRSFGMWLPSRPILSGSVVQDDGEEGAVDFEAAVVLMRPSFLNWFMKKFTRARVAPIISASVSCETFGNARWGLVRSYCASSRSVRASRFSLELNS